MDLIAGLEKGAFQHPFGLTLKLSDNFLKVLGSV
jgi:hypothetical protein